MLLYQSWQRLLLVIQQRYSIWIINEIRSLFHSFHNILKLSLKVNFILCQLATQFKNILHYIFVMFSLSAGASRARKWKKLTKQKFCFAFNSAAFAFDYLICGFIIILYNPRRFELSLAIVSVIILWLILGLSHHFIQYFDIFNDMRNLCDATDCNRHSMHSCFGATSSKLSFFALLLDFYKYLYCLYGKNRNEAWAYTCA